MDTRENVLLQWSYCINFPWCPCLKPFHSEVILDYRGAVKPKCGTLMCPHPPCTSNLLHNQGTLIKIQKLTFVQRGTRFTWTSPLGSRACQERVLCLPPTCRPQQFAVSFCKPLRAGSRSSPSEHLAGRWSLSPAVDRLAPSACALSRGCTRCTPC